MPNLKSLKQLVKIAEEVAPAAKKLEDLPMDLESRMARAKEMGFDVNNPVYHGTNQEFSNFRFDPHSDKTFGPGVYTTSNPKIASDYAGYSGSSGQQVYPLVLKGKIFDINNPEHLALLSKKEYETSKQMIPEVKKMGFDHFRNENEIVTFDPKNIRSKFAKFDPSKADSDNIAAGLSAVGLGGLAAKQALQSGQPETEEERWQKTMSLLGPK